MSLFVISKIRQAIGNTQLDHRPKKIRRSNYCGFLANLTSGYKLRRVNPYDQLARGLTYMPGLGTGILRAAISGALDLLEHLEYALGGTNKKTLECLAQATAFEGVATRTFDFCHDDLRSVHDRPANMQARKIFSEPNILP